MWLGGRFRGVLLPKFFMNLAGEGGRTTYLPGGDFTFTVRTGDVELVPAIGVASLGLGPTPFKPADTPDTEWEIVESDLFALTLTLDVAWVIPLDDAGLVALRLGGSVGLGWALAGDLYRTQAYPSDGEPGDPYSYEKCAGPNDPAGSFRYCNQLDKDADRYGQPDDPWGDGGARPIIYPWLVLPQIGLSFYPDDQFAIDVSVGTSLMGLVTDVGFRIGL
jgi:hypothetical protein